MQDNVKELCLLFAMHQNEVKDTVARYADAYDEDLVKNADMFDTARLTFSENKHPNRTMRVLEDDLREAEPTLLYLLTALCEVGMDLVLYPEDFASCYEFADAVSTEYTRLAAQQPSAPRLAQKLTEIKAEHAYKRLSKAAEMMKKCL
jgi:hypothetical protein